MANKTIKKQTRKTKNGAWFTPVRSSYLPANWKGWATYIPFVGYLVFSLVAAFDYTGNDIKAILWIVPNWVAAAVVLTWVAKRTS